MICFKPNGSVIMKENICSCDDCVVCNFLECSEEKGVEVIAVDDTNDDNDNDSDIEDESDAFGEDMVDENEEMYEMRR